VRLADGRNRPNEILARGLSIDLEVGRIGKRIHRFAAVRCDSGESFEYASGNLQAALKNLDHFADGATSLIGHNLLEFDAVHLAAANPDLRILRLPRIDTLRLNPIAFPRNPYHHLVKHYQDGGLKRAQFNDPKLDAELTLYLLRDQREALRKLSNSDPELALALHGLVTADPESGGMHAVFADARASSRPTQSEAQVAIMRRFDGEMCRTHAEQLIARLDTNPWPMAYAIAWLSVAGGNSVTSPWVAHQFPETFRIVQLLRDSACRDPACHWCRTRHDAQAELERWFGFKSFRPEPADAAGHPLQQAIVEASMAGQYVLGILPTGTGKSVCYQIPALSRYDKTGAITVVISPLVALMSDQIAGLERQGISNCAALNGLLSMPERSDVLDRVRLGDVSVLIVSPEQLRSRGLRRVLEQRQIGGWVLDEAHCLSKWGHDFRPDYRYVGRYIRERAGEAPIPPIQCLTATAKPDVIADILTYFRESLGVELVAYDGGSLRNNLDFVVLQTTPAEKFARVCQVIQADLPEHVPGGAIVYCATRRNTEELAAFLHAKGIPAEYFHAGLPPETKKDVQSRFINGEIRVIAATNAFGMGIDKSDVRLVVHSDIPGSLENYLQEAGRAGRDREPARCVLLFTREDVERQFGMSARSRLNQREINGILRALRRIDRKKRLEGEVVATTGEILLDEQEGAFERDSATDDTRVRTAVSWLEEAKLLRRDENRVAIFPSSLRVASLDEARDRLTKRQIVAPYASQLLRIVSALFEADPDDGVSTDELMGYTGLSSEGVRKALHDLEAIGIASNDTPLTAFVHAGVERSSAARLETAMGLESAMIEKLQELAPELGHGETSTLHVRQLTQALIDDGVASALPERLRRVLKSLAKDDHGDDTARGSLSLRSLNRETVRVTLLRSWSALARTAELRRKAAQAILEKLLSELPQGTRGTDLLVETTFGDLRASLTTDLLLKAEVRDFDRLMEHALLWLHEQEVIRINKGLVVFRSAMTIRLDERGGSFLKADFEPLLQHYGEQTVQIHVMAEYAQRGLAAKADAARLVMDYFALPSAQFVQKWLPGRQKELQRQTLPETWRAIVESLRDPVQQRIVADDREQTNVLVLAGPGSGKTRVLVHRIAYLVRVRRENPREILALAYNRHAAVEIRKRLTALVGDDARRITVLTCHAMAMRLTGHCFTGKRIELNDGSFREIMRQAAALVRGEGLPPDEADDQRERLLEGFRWILVDEYQDIEAEQYELIGALAGLKRNDEQGRLSLFAVGDDDQNIYSFAGASVEFIRRFEQDYLAKPAYLTDNYRSTANIIAAANQIIEPAHNRMKEHHPIRIDRRRESSPPGGALSKWDSVASGCVQILAVPNGYEQQAIGVMTELQRLSALVPDWSWKKTAVIARNWEALSSVRNFCELHDIPVQSAADELGNLWRYREVQVLVQELPSSDHRLIDAATLRERLVDRDSGPYWTVLREAVEEYGLDTGEQEQPLGHFLEWLVDWCRNVRHRQSGLLLTSAHRAKGLEFDHVAVLDGDWARSNRGEDPDAPRRLYYVAMTRAKQSLLLARMDHRGHMLESIERSPEIMERQGQPIDSVPAELYRLRKRLTPADVDLGFAGSFAPGHRIHWRIEKLQPGDPLQLRQREGKWEIYDSASELVGRMSGRFDLSASMKCLEVSVAAVLKRFDVDSLPEFQGRVRSPAWEIVIPELVLEPVAPSGRVTSSLPTSPGQQLDERAVADQ
jgi:ATP-dependent DNA helicase RecQ